MNRTKNMIVVDNLFIICCFLIVALTKCKSLSLVLLFCVVSVIPILYCSYWHCMFVWEPMHSTYTGLFSHADGPNLIKRHFFPCQLIWSLTLIHSRCLWHTPLRKRQQQRLQLHPAMAWPWYLLSCSRSPIIFEFFFSIRQKQNGIQEQRLLLCQEIWSFHESSTQCDWRGRSATDHCFRGGGWGIGDAS